MIDPVLARLEAAYRVSRLEVDRQAWIHSLLARELIKGSDIRVSSFDVKGRPLARPNDTQSPWWHVQEFSPPLYAYTAPGLTRCVASGHVRLVKVHATRDILTRQVWACGVVPEWFINYVMDWRPSRIVLPAR